MRAFLLEIATNSEGAFALTHPDKIDRHNDIEGLEASVLDVFKFSALLMLAIGVVLFFFTDLLIVGSVWFGALVVFVLGWLMGRSIEAATEAGPDVGQKVLVVGSGKRFVLIIAALLVAYAIGLHLLFVALGLFLAQLLVMIIGFRKSLQFG